MDAAWGFIIFLVFLAVVSLLMAWGMSELMDNDLGPWDCDERGPWEDR